MADVFISYARSNAKQAQAVGEALRALGYSVWRDDELPAHRAYAEVIEERLKAARAVVVVWSAEAARSQWVRAEADFARHAGTLVQLSIDGAVPPLPFNQIQCADMLGWSGRADVPGWRKVVGSVADLVGTAPDRRAALVANPHQSAGATRWAASATVAAIVVAAIAALFLWGPFRKAPPPLAPMLSVAILPIRNLTGDASLDAVADTMTEDAIDVVGRTGLIAVTPRDATFALKGKPIDEPMLGKQLHVRYVVTASLRRSTPGYRVTLQIVDTTSGQLVGAKDLGSAAPEADLAERQLALKLFGAITELVRRRWVDAELTRPPDDRDPENLLARLEKLGGDIRRQDIGKAEALIAKGREAISRDNRIRAEFDMTACEYESGLIGAGFGSSPAQRAVWAAAALDLGAEAADLRPNATAPHVCRAEIFGELERWDEATAEARHIINILPLTANGYGTLASVELAQGRFAGALKDFTEFAARTDGDPGDLGTTQLFLGKYDAAIDDLREFAVLDPKNPQAPFLLTAALELSGRHDQATSQARLYQGLKSDDDAWRTLALSHEPSFVRAAGVIRHALHDAGLDEPGVGAADAR